MVFALVCATFSASSSFGRSENVSLFLEFADMSYIAYDINRKIASELSIEIDWNEIT
jgi:hypothetical protein